MLFFCFCFFGLQHVFPFDYRAAELPTYVSNLSLMFVDFFAWIGEYKKKNKKKSVSIVTGHCLTRKHFTRAQAGQLT